MSYSTQMKGRVVDYERYVHLVDSFQRHIRYVIVLRVKVGGREKFPFQNVKSTLWSVRVWNPGRPTISCLIALRDL